MRYGVVSDVHANAVALRTAIARLKAVGVDEWLCAGDIVGYGPQPNECVELLAELGARCVAGNHELLVLGRLPLERSGRLARETTPWTRSVLRDDCRRYLAALPTTVRVPGVLMAHGSITDPTRYVRQPEQAVGELATLARVDAQATVLVLGHTHRPWMVCEDGGTVPAAPGPATAFPPTGRVLVNPGSVGHSRQDEPVPRTRFLLLDIEQRQVRFFAETYDVAGALAALREHGLPRSCIHVRPGRLWAVPRRAQTLIRYARRHIGA
ncbi:metallophosphoesterase family protein [Planosporangium thailandense]|uniref:Metallophosphoesterase family protein n=1 Tax=Planosporangium thailandense TaxID=765197 RepID=A0ABX0Y1E7_9ACTN|nr:metallophosphoesterase family protein [Planosporangium thailandense]NJC71274.1 metallophosphoesterase family protein [Planosporangium thailandense]